MIRRIKEHQAELSFSMEPLKQDIFVSKKSVQQKTKITAPLEENFLPASHGPQMMSVGAVTRRVASLLEKEIGSVWVEGEISNYRKQSSGHHYFTLKDSEAQIACVLFSRTAALFKEISLQDGMAMQLYGDITVYQPRGQYQLMVRLVQTQGQGILQAKFEALKQKLADEGLFETTRKRALPRFPKRIGIVTSPTGAALADFLHVLHRRHPGLQVVIHPVRVQGQGAAQEIAAAITEFSEQKQSIGSVDIIVVARGGGSLEDLWGFNEEIVARAIARSSVPVVSAVGHEIDFTIADFVADLRAPTPSAAAELIATDALALLEKLESFVWQIKRAVQTNLHQLVVRKNFIETATFFRAPDRWLAETRQRIDLLEETLSLQIERRCEQLNASLATMQAHYRSLNPSFLLMQIRQRYQVAKRCLNTQLLYQQETLQKRVAHVRSALAALSPNATLARGFTITRNEKGEVLTSVKKAKQAKKLSTQFFDGEVGSVT